MIYQFGPNQPGNVTGDPRRILDTGGKWARIRLQVLDASLLFFGKTKDEMQQTGPGGLQCGLQLKQGDGIFADWWNGELWAVNTTANAVINYEIDYPPIGLPHD